MGKGCSPRHVVLGELGICPSETETGSRLPTPPRKQLDMDPRLAQNSRQRAEGKGAWTWVMAAVLLASDPNSTALESKWERVGPPSPPPPTPLTSQGAERKEHNDGRCP